MNLNPFIPARIIHDISGAATTRNKLADTEPKRRVKASEREHQAAAVIAQFAVGQSFSTGDAIRTANALGFLDGWEQSRYRSAAIWLAGQVLKGRLYRKKTAYSVEWCRPIRDVPPEEGEPEKEPVARRPRWDKGLTDKQAAQAKAKGDAAALSAIRARLGLGPWTAQEFINELHRIGQRASRFSARDRLAELIAQDRLTPIWNSNHTRITHYRIKEHAA